MRIQAIAAWLVLCGCGDDQAASGTTGAESTSPVGTVSTNTSAPTPQTTDASVTASESTDASTTTTTTTSGTSSSTGPATKLEVEVERFDTQPMVVDVTITTTAPAQIELEHANDLGVLIERTNDDPATHRFRVRGLRPDAEHTLRCTLTEDGSDPIDEDVTFDTLPALPGFLGAFPLELSATDPDPLYRLFDTLLVTASTAGVSFVDPVGITRWYFGGTTDVPLHVRPLAGVKLLADGTVAFLQGHTAFVVDELGNIIVELGDGDLGMTGLHHEILQLPGGNFLALSHSFSNVDYPGQGTLYVAGDRIVEFTADGEVVWTWNTFDHLDPQRVRHGFFELGLVIHPDTAELAFDWTHSNGIEYDPADHSIVLSIRHQDWLVKIDHESGDIQWRLGDEGDFALQGDATWFFHPHSPHWLPDGTLAVYDNGNGNPNVADEDEVSRALQYDVDETTMTATQLWQDNEAPFMSPIAGDVDPLPSGHLQVLDSSISENGTSQARLREIENTEDAPRVWTLTPPPNVFIYRATAHERIAGQPR